MKTSPYIFKTTPHLVEKVWGGRRLEELFGKHLPGDESFGEAWEVSDLDEGQSRVGTGPLKGLPLRALSEGWQRALVGAKAPREDRFPLLVKLLDANDDLSVQVHPGPEDARRIENAASKRESWLILSSKAPDGGAAKVIHGLSRDDISPQEFRQAAEEGELEQLLRRVEVEPGDVVDVEPGTIHAICRGVALLEIQEPSDTTYRVYDYDRPGLDGEPRPLHIDEALDVAALRRSAKIVRSPVEEHGLVEVLSVNDSYRIERFRTDDTGPVEWSVDPDSPQILHLLEGRLKLEDGIGSTIELGPYETAIVPAIVGAVRGRIEEPMTLVVSGLSVHHLVRSPRAGALRTAKLR